MVKVSKINYKNYGECIEITNGQTVMRITCEFGPRVIYFGGIDENNLMYEDALDLINKGGEYFDQNFKKGEMWHIYGGHRLWKSPEDLASYFPDNYKVEVKLFENGGEFSSAKEVTTGIQKTIKFLMSEKGDIEVTHTFTNFTDADVKYSLWGLSVMNKGGVAYVPFSQKDTGLLANRNLVIWPYTNIKDARIDIKQDAIVLRQDKNALTPIKLGTLSTVGLTYYLYDDKLFRKSFEPADINADYPDFCSNVEVYTNDIMLEVETLSQLKTIPSGTSFSAKEIWTLFDSKSEIYHEIKGKIYE